MTFVSFEFCLLCFPIFFGLYYACSKNVRLQNIILFIGNILFYLTYEIKYSLVLLACVLISYFGGIAGAKAKKNGNRIFILAFVLNVLILCFFKYCNSVMDFGSYVLPFLKSISLPKILLPTGISFYVFQSSSYLFDLKNGKIESPEKNFIDYFVFVSFFPTIVSGPIQRGRNLLPQLKKQRKFNFYNLQSAVLMFLYGAFIKCVIADRINEFTNSVYSSLDTVSWLSLIICAALYSIQIYADFAGYSFMAIAVSKALGINAGENFRQPYLALNIPDFWRRWHISLTSWLTEYVYFPLGGSRKGTARKYLNIIIVFFVSGMWHGSDVSFIVWGLLHGFYQIFGYITKDAREKFCKLLHINRESFIYKWFQRIIVFGLVTVSWIFFRAENLSQAVLFIKKILFFSSGLLISASGTLLTKDYAIIFLGIILMIVFSSVQEKINIFEKICSFKIGYRILIAAVMLYVIVLLGYFSGLSSSSFIYAGF